jgi:vacuolar-type H+-ATPase subunit I/STV1
MIHLIAEQTKKVKAAIHRCLTYCRGETGMGTVEVVLILAVLVGIALIFRTYLFSFVNDIMGNILGDTLSEIRNNPLVQG